VADGPFFLSPSQFVKREKTVSREEQDWRLDPSQFPQTVPFEGLGIASTIDSQHQAL